MKAKLTFIIVLSVFILSCKSTAPISENKIDSTQKDTISHNKGNDNFELLYQKLTTSIKTKNATLFNQLIYPNYGLYMIESAGAMPEIKKVYKIETYKQTANSISFFELPFDSLNLMPIKEKLPKISCDINIYDKQGCYSEEINALKNSNIWNYANLNEKEAQAVQFVSETIEITVINTYNYVFYFSKIDNNWWITFIDVRIPCSA